LKIIAIWRRISDPRSSPFSGSPFFSVKVKGKRYKVFYL